jgi:signal transduction histidine kinase
MNLNKVEYKWLSGGGAMSELILSTDWAATPLGPIDTWPVSLQTTVSLCLASNFPINIVWGPQAIQIYNAGYRVLCGDAHPRAMGESYRVTWESAWTVIGEPFEKASRGETSYIENQRMFLNRNGYLEETFFTFSLSPIRDELGKVVGLFHPVTETTAVMLNERRLRALRDISARAGNAESVELACKLVAEALSPYRYDVPFMMVYQYDPANAAVKLLSSSHAMIGPADFPNTIPLNRAPWPFHALLASGEMTLVSDVIARIGSIECADYAEAVSGALLLALAPNSLGPPFGFAVVGLSTRLPKDESYRQFVEMLGEAASKAIGGALAYENEKRKKEELAAIDKAKTEFFSNVSHEFRTPLTLMLGPLEDSLNDAQEPLLPRQRERQERINRNALRLLKLVNTLLDFSRIQAGRIDSHYRPTNLPRLTVDLASIFRASIEKAGIKFSVEVEDLQEPVFVDHDMWEKIVLNLLSNAFKFTYHGEISVRLRRLDNSVCLSVADTGTGIPAKELPNLFQRFHRVENAKGRTFEGSGIGLALISELVKLHGGVIVANSQEHVGSTFEVTIPLGSAHLPNDRLRPGVDAGSVSPMGSSFIEEVVGWLPDRIGAISENFLAAPIPGVEVDALATPSVRKRILVADDNADMRSYLSQLLAPLGVVEVVNDGEAAVQSIRRATPNLIVSDLMMPKLDGFGLLKWLRSEPATVAIPFVLLSAKASENFRIEGLEKGADDFLAKPFFAKELVARASTQLKLGEARRLAEIERNRLYEFFMRAPVPMVILIGPDHRFFLANEPYKKLIGRQVMGRTVSEVFPAPDVDLFIPILDEVYSTGAPFVGTNLPFRVVDEVGELHDSFLDVSYQPFRETSGEIKGLLAIVIDATDRVVARAVIEKAVADLTEERALRDRFVTTLGHDLRTPLSAAQMGGDLLQLMPHATAEVKAVAARIVRNTKRVDAMICDLLDANRLRAGELMPYVTQDCRLDQLLSVITDELTELHGPRFVEKNDGGNLQAQWDESALRRIVENLAGNAVKYGQKNTPITLGLATFGDQVEISVHNEGDPISPSQQEKIFQPFHRIEGASSSINSGWGVGLGLVKASAEAQGGQVRVESHPNLGTTFFVMLPIVKSSA